MRRLRLQRDALLFWRLYLGDEDVVLEVPVSDYLFCFRFVLSVVGLVCLTRWFIKERSLQK